MEHQGFVVEENYVKYDSWFYREPAANTGVMWSLLLVLVSTQAAAFWINWRDLRDLLEPPDNKELHYSSLEVTNMWTSCSASFWDKMCLIF